MWGAPERSLARKYFYTERLFALYAKPVREVFFNQSVVKESRCGEFNGRFKFLFDKYQSRKWIWALLSQPKLYMSENWLLRESLSNRLPGTLDMVGADF